MAGGPKPARVTIHEVAARAGVSIATVSRVVNDSRPVAADLHERVLAAVEELGYRANLLGRALRQGRSQSVGLVVPDLENPFFATLTQKVSRAFNTMGIDVLVFSSDNDPDHERRAITSFLGRQVDGLVVIPCDETRSAANVRMASHSVVTVQLDRLATSVATHFVGCDNTYGIKLIADHVREVTRRSREPVVFVAARPSSSSAHERLDSFAAAFPDARQVLGTFSYEFGRRAMDELLQEGLRKAFIVTDADVIALGVIASVNAHSLSVPGDFRVTGFDDVGVSLLAQPGLTTVRQSVDEMCEAITAILGHSRSELQPASELVVRRFKPSLVIRDSSPELSPS